MRPRQPIPTRWLMTDERLGDLLWDSVAALPRGGGVVFRHYGLPPEERRVLFRRLARLTRRRGIVLVRAGRPLCVRREDGVHNSRGQGLLTGAAHDRREAVAAVRRGVEVLFVSPVFPTRSHPGTRTLGVRRLRTITAGLDATVIALGGMDEARFRRVQRLGVHGWAGIDAWAPDQKRKAVPT